MLIKVGKMPGRIEEVVLEEGAKVAEALEIAELSAEGFQIRVNSEEATEDRALVDGDIVLLTKMIKGNSPIIKVGKMPGRIEEIAIEDGTTVAQALEIAGLDSEGFQVRVNSEAAELTQTVTDGDIVLLTKMIKGN